MQTDFVGLATRVVAGVEGIRACLVLSRDGLTLGAHPADGESRAKEAWKRLHAAGDPQRGFLDVGQEIIAVVRRGAYTGVVVAAPDVRPGLLLDVLETHLRAAEEERSRATTAATAPAPDAASPRSDPSRRRRPARHTAAARPAAEGTPPRAGDPAQEAPEPASDQVAEPELRPASAGAPERRVVDLSDQPVASGGRWGARLRRLADATSDPAVEDEGAPAFEEAVTGPARPEPDDPAGATEAPTAPRPPVDRSALAREFGRLLSDPGAGD